MRFREVVGRLTGISTPVFGVSWNPPKSDRDIAASLLSFLEDRRVLYNPYELESPEHCVESVVEIRRELTASIQASGRGSALSEHLQAMRAACRKFLDSIASVERRPFRPFGPSSLSGVQGWIFLTALGEMRGVFGVHIAQIAAKFGLDISDELASMIPAKVEEKAEK